MVSLIKRPRYAGGGTYSCPECGARCSDYPGEHNTCPSCGAPLQWGQQCRYCEHCDWDNAKEEWHCWIEHKDVPYFHSCPNWESVNTSTLEFHPFPVRPGIYTCGRCHVAFAQAWQQKKTCPHCGIKNTWKKSCVSCRHYDNDWEVLVCKKTGNTVATSDVCPDWEEKLRIFTEAKL